jgi:glc operon protein GlcG
MDGAFVAGVDLCMGKARSALRLEEPTAKIESTIHDGRYALVTAGAVEMQGGIPLKRRGEIIGAIGVSGADSSVDIPIAEAAVEDPAQ